MTPSSSGLDSRTTPDGTEVYVDRNDAERGKLAPFLPFHADPAGTDRLGFFCGNCESFEPAMDTMGRIECPDCANERLPTRTDAGYL